jgi:Fe-S oxidoreductase
MQIMLFVTCFNDTLYQQTDKAVVKLLEQLSHTVDFPLEQTCCGQVNGNRAKGLTRVELRRVEAYNAQTTLV